MIALGVTAFVCGTVLAVFAGLCYTCSLPSKLASSWNERRAGIATATVSVFLLAIGTTAYVLVPIGVAW